MSLEKPSMFEEKPLSELKCNPCDMIGKGWYLLTAGTPEDYNTMTCSWGAMGEIWGVPSFHCFVRPTRYTLSYLKKNDLFTASFFSPGYRAALSFCGSNSGRTRDKAKETGLMPVSVGGSTGFAQALQVLVCRKTYIGAMDETGFLKQEDYQKWYETEPMHQAVVGEIIGYYVRTR